MKPLTLVISSTLIRREDIDIILPPVNTVLPSFTGTQKVNETLFGNDGTYNNSPTTFVRRWTRNGSPISGATSINYTLTTADYGQIIRYTVEPFNAAGSGGVSVSSASDAIAPANPVPLSAPSIDGVAEEGETLTVTHATFSYQGTLAIDTQWYRNGVAIGGATGSTYVVQSADVNKTLTVGEIGSNAGGDSEEIFSTGFQIGAPSQPSFFVVQFSTTTGDKGFLWLPSNMFTHSRPMGCLLHGHGNGERGQPNENTIYILGTGNGSTTGFSGNVTNSGKRILHTSVRITVNNVEVAQGYGGVIAGSGVSGTYDQNDGSNAAWSLTFSVAPANGHVIRMICTISDLLNDSTLPRILNSGDDLTYSRWSESWDMMILCLQISRTSGGFVTTTEWDQVLDMLEANYRLNRNRVGPTGFSLGGDYATFVHSQRPTEFAFLLAVSTGTNASIPAGNSSIWASGGLGAKYWVQGSSDSTGTITCHSAMANCNKKTQKYLVRAKMFWGVGHSDDAIAYNRRDRTDAVGTCPYDYAELLFIHSLDPEEEATWFVHKAQYTEDSGDYREAKNLVDNLSPGAVKTALLADLVTLKAIIGNWIIVDMGANSSDGNVNNITSPAAGTTISNCINDEGGNTGISFTITTPGAAVPGQVNPLSESRLRGRHWGLEYDTTVDGHTIESTGTEFQGTYAGLNTAKTYKLKIYVGASSNTYTARAEAECTIGATTKFSYVDNNNFDFVTFDVPASVSSFVFKVKVRQTASTEKTLYLLGHELVLNP